MGVLNCSRRDCENIMCDIYVSDVGYICYECVQEFKEYLKKNNIEPDTEAKIKKVMGIFMNTTKGLFMDNENISVDEFFLKHTRSL